MARSRSTATSSSPVASDTYICPRRIDCRIPSGRSAPGISSTSFSSRTAGPWATPRVSTICQRRRRITKRLPTRPWWHLPISMPATDQGVMIHHREEQDVDAAVPAGLRQASREELYDLNERSTLHAQRLTTRRMLSCVSRWKSACGSASGTEDNHRLTEQPCRYEFEPYAGPL